jgi:hypothetical protein
LLKRERRKKLSAKNLIEGVHGVLEKTKRADNTGENGREESWE